MNYGNLLSHDYGVASGKWLSTKTLDVALRIRFNRVYKNPSEAWKPS